MSNKSDFSNLLRWFIVVNIFMTVRSASLLGAQCRSSSDCAVRHAHCSSSRCACDPYYAQVDNSTCLESTLLGSECVVSEQCTLKVAYSACLEGVCRCTDGHLQFRKHTCLSPAPPGHVCYSNEHCRLWDRESHCEFVIPNLFGRCSCNPFFRLTGDKCVAQKPLTEAVVAEQEAVIVDANGTILDHSNRKPPTSSAIKPSEVPFGPLNTIAATAGDVQPSNLPMFTSKNEILSTQEDSPLMQAVMKVPEPSKRLPVSTRKEGEPNDTVGIGELTANLHANDQPIYRVVTQPSVEKKSNKKNVSSKDQQKPFKSGHQKKSSLKDKQRIRTDSVADIGPASLGMPCLTDSQCHLVDPYTRCLNKRCDCAFRTNSTSACSARNRGCLPGTFQCRSTGACISWYFVCDGRKDCPDGSDETCQGTGKGRMGTFTRQESTSASQEETTAEKKRRFHRLASMVQGNAVPCTLSAAAVLGHAACRARHAATARRSARAERTRGTAGRPGGRVARDTRSAVGRESACQSTSSATRSYPARTPRTNRHISATNNRDGGLQTSARCVAATAAAGARRSRVRGATAAGITAMRLLAACVVVPRRKFHNKRLENSL